MADEEAEVVRMLARKKVRVANHNHALPGIMVEEGRGESCGGVERFQVPRGHRLNEATDISTRYLRQLFAMASRCQFGLKTSPGRTTPRYRPRACDPCARPPPRWCRCRRRDPALRGRSSSIRPTSTSGCGVGKPTLARLPSLPRQVKPSRQSRSNATGEPAAA